MHLDTLPDATSRCLRKMPLAFSAALFEQIFTLWRETVVHLRQAAVAREDAHQARLKVFHWGRLTGTAENFSFFLAKPAPKHLPFGRYFDIVYKHLSVRVRAEVAQW